MQYSGASNHFLSVEVSHIYLDQEFSSEQQKSIECFMRESAGWNEPHYEVVLFDDYNIKELRTSHDEVITRLGELGVSPRYYAFEKDLLQYSAEFLSAIKVPKLKRQYDTYIAKYAKHPCSLLTSIWYLLRLGVIEDTYRVIRPLKENDVFQPAEKLVNILPDYFSDVEQKAGILISSSIYKQAISGIRNVYFEAESNIPEQKRIG